MFAERLFSWRDEGSANWIIDGDAALGLLLPPPHGVGMGLQFVWIIIQLRAGLGRAAAFAGILVMPSPGIELDYFSGGKECPNSPS